MNERRRTLEEATALEVWSSYRETMIPPIGTSEGETSAFSVERMESAFMCGAYFALSMAQRLTQETPERMKANLDRLEGEVLVRIGALDPIAGKPS